MADDTVEEHAPETPAERGAGTATTTASVPPLLPVLTAYPGDTLPPLPASAYPPEAQPLPEATPQSRPEQTEAGADARLVDVVRHRLAHSPHGVSADVRVSFANGVLIFDAASVQAAQHAAGAALDSDGVANDGRAWRYIGSGPDLDTGRARAYVRVTPLD